MAACDIACNEDAPVRNGCLGNQEGTEEATRDDTVAVVLVEEHSSSSVLVGGAEPAFLAYSENIHTENETIEDLPDAGDEGADQDADETGPGAWLPNEVRVFIATCGDYKEAFNDPKQKQIEVWKAVSDVLARRNVHRAPLECRNKFKGLKRTYFSRIKNKRVTGRGRREWPFMKEMHAILSARVLNNAPLLTVPPAVESATPPSAITEAEHPTLQGQHFGSGETYSQRLPDALETENDDIDATEGASQAAPQAPSDHPPRRKRPATLLREILQRMDAWEAEDRRRYRQQLKIQRMKLRLLQQLVNRQHDT
ncbi:uncharacterized protein LOC135378534 isoform X3 [Ornithodoros turicata]|uniref:uncharacterized protein LOC135378534 isoform X3 n=1 Tax=Ornithodoros turicata TaxID=34597 RepID=UPI003139DE04